MRLVLTAALVLFAATSVLAQSPDSAAVPRAELAFEGTLVGVAVWAAAGTFLATAGVEDGRWGLPAYGAYTAGVAMGVVLASRVRGVEGSAEWVPVGAAIGAGAGLVVGAALAEAAGGRWNGLEAIIGAALVGPPVGAALGWQPARVEVAPAAFRAPTGESGAGLGLRIGL